MSAETRWPPGKRFKANTAHHFHAFAREHSNDLASLGPRNHKALENVFIENYALRATLGALDGWDDSTVNLYTQVNDHGSEEGRSVCLDLDINS
jgi:hypothetical protein